MNVGRQLRPCRLTVSYLQRCCSSSSKPPSKDKDGDGEGDGDCEKTGEKTSEQPGKSGPDDKGSARSKDCAKLKAGSICAKDAEKVEELKKKAAGKDIFSPCGSPKDKDKSESKGKDKAEKTEDKNKPKITLIDGDGPVGPELSQALQQVFSAAKVPIEWEIFSKHSTPENQDELAPELLDSLLKNKVGIKGPIVNYNWQRQLRKQAQLFAFVAVCRSIETYCTPYGKLDCVIIRDKTEGEYTGIEHRVVPGVMQTIKVSTTAAAHRLAKYVFHYADAKCRNKITVAHKANIMKLTDGNFLGAMRRVAAKHQDRQQLDERYLDTVCLQLLMNPRSNDVLVSSSMYGDVLAMIASSILGGQALCPCFHVSAKALLYDCLQEDDSVANPTGLLLSGAIMLRDLKLDQYADKIESAVASVFKDKEALTKDLGGKATCAEFTKTLCDAIEKIEEEAE